MGARDKVLAIRKIQKEREEIAIAIEVFEGERWDGFFGGMKGVLTCILSSIVFAVLVRMIGGIANIQYFAQMYMFLGFIVGIVFSQCVRNQKNEKIQREIQVLRNKYKELTRKTKDIIYA